MKLYGYMNENGKIKQAEIEVEEKVVLVPKVNGKFPFTYDGQIDRNMVGEVIGYYPTIFLQEPNFSYAKEKFLEEARRVIAENQNALAEVSKRMDDNKKKLEDLEQASEGDSLEEEC